MALCAKTQKKTMLTAVSVLVRNNRVPANGAVFATSAIARAIPALSRSQLNLHQWSLSRRALVEVQLRRYCEERQPTCFHIQDGDDFRQRVIQNDKPVIVDFYADWCAPCRLLGPRLESMVDTRLGSLFLAKVNIDENADLAMDYDIQSVPTVMAFKNGEIVDKFVGVIEDEELNKFLTKLED